MSNPISTLELARLADRVDELRAVNDELRALNEAFMNDVGSTIRGEMSRSVIIDPSIGQAKLPDRSAYRTIQDAMLDTVPSSKLEARLVPDVAHATIPRINLNGVAVTFVNAGGGSARPSIRVGVTSDGSENYFHQFYPDKGGESVSLIGVDLELPSVKIDGALPWDAIRTAWVRHSINIATRVQLNDVTVTGGVAGETLGIVSTHRSRVSFVAIDSILNGPLVAVANAETGDAIPWTSNLQLINGARLLSTDA